MHQVRRSKVAIAENDEVLAFLIAETCRVAGFNVVGTVPDASAAAALVATECADILIADFALDGQQDGLELIDAVRNSGADVVTILVTGWDLRVIENRLARVRPDRVLLKPVLPSDLAAVLESAIDERALRRRPDTALARAA